MFATTDIAGGLIGRAFGGNINRCYSDSDVHGASYVGGLAGFYNGDANNCYASGDVIATGSRIGGLFGEASGSIHIVRKCNAKSDVTSTGSEVGGLIGYLSSSNNTEVIECYPIGNTLGSGIVGGLVGEVTDGTIINTYSSGIVTGVSGNIGGLVGNFAGPTGFTAESYWYMEVSGESFSAGS